ncbi:MAG: S8 family peptidase [Candidatus Anammoxibacter sp.]
MLKSLNLVLSLFFSLSLLNTGITQAGNRPSRNIKNLFVKNQILVQFEDYVTYDEKAEIHRKCGNLSFRKSYRNRFHLVTIEDGEIRRTINLYLKNSKVKYAEPNYIVQAYLSPNDRAFKFQWNLSQINCEKAWDISTGQGIVVAIVDTGVNPNGFDSFGMNVIDGRNFVRFSKDKNSFDDNGHGTHVAGTVAQATNNRRGVAGVAFDATILSVKVLNRYGIGSTRSVINGIAWAAENGAHIINLSLGSSERSDIMEKTVKEAYDKGIVIVAAAGNESGSVGFPAAFEPVIAVGSVRFDKSLSFFSNFGPEIDVVAPGGDMNVDQNSDGRLDGILQETFTIGFFTRNFNWRLSQLQGTSQASPHVAGVAALILEKNPMFTPDEVREAIFRTAKDLGEPGRDDTFGWGLIDAAAALAPLPTLTPTPEPSVTPTPDPTPLP